MTTSEAGRLDRARLLYERAVFGGDPDAPDAADRELDAVEAGLALARGRVLHARFLRDRREDPRELTLFERAVELYQGLGDQRGQAEALFWVGTVHQVIRADHTTALPVLLRAHDLAVAAGDVLTASYTTRHIGFADMAAGRMEAAGRRLRESIRLRREIDFRPGVAAGLLALAEWAAATGDRGLTRELLDEAVSVARDSDAHAVIGWADQARARIGAVSGEERGLE
ncbi:hypothetical protein ACQPZF_03970 [Actinosynnema sp. CS-041913]|uniref:hypothetical protein n=1 Tax=Actinosynnema sp. CS-041913 TaxID=3239917 RepID=UPI003D911BE7